MCPLMEFECGDWCLWHESDLMCVIHVRAKPARSRAQTTACYLCDISLAVSNESNPTEVSESIPVISSNHHESDIHLL